MAGWAGLGWAGLKGFRGEGGWGGHGQPIVQGKHKVFTARHCLTMHPEISRVPKARAPSVHKKTKLGSFKSNKCH